LSENRTAVLVITSPHGARERVYVGEVDGDELLQKVRNSRHGELKFFPGSRTIVWYSGKSSGLDGLINRGPHNDERLLEPVKTDRYVLGVREIALLTPEAWKACQEWPVWRLESNND